MPEKNPPLESLKLGDVELLSTAAALRRLAQGPDDRAWTTVLNRHGVEILRATRRILGDPMSAEDACQETLLQIRDRAGQFRGRPDGTGAPHPTDATARNWIMRIACNTALHMLRQRKRAKLREQNVARETPQVIDAPELCGGPHDELSSQVRAELAELPEKQRLPLTLHFFAGLDYEQLSAELRCGVGAARVRVHRALEKLRQRMAALGILVTTAAIYTLLSSSTASAAEAMLDPERLGRWKELLFSTQHAAINVVSDPQFHALGKIGYAVASAAICGTLAFSYSAKQPQQGAPVSPGPVAQNTHPQQQAMKEWLFPRPAESAPAAPRDLHQIMTQVRFIDTTDSFLERIGVSFTGLDPTVSETPLAVAPLDPKPEPASAAAPVAENRQAALVSPLAQLEMLQAMQHDLNARVTRLHQELEAHRAITGAAGITSEDQLRLRRAADDQEKLANLIRQIADELRYARPAENKQAMH